MSQTTNNGSYYVFNGIAMSDDAQPASRLPGDRPARPQFVARGRSAEHVATGDQSPAPTARSRARRDPAGSTSQSPSQADGVRRGDPAAGGPAADRGRAHRRHRA